MDIPFEELVQAVQRLTPEQKAELIHVLELPHPDQSGESLYGKYRGSSSIHDDVSDDTLRSFIRGLHTAWTEDLDDHP